MKETDQLRAQIRAMKEQVAESALREERRMVENRRLVEDIRRLSAEKKDDVAENAPNAAALISEVRTLKSQLKRSNDKISELESTIRRYQNNPQPQQADERKREVTPPPDRDRDRDRGGYRDRERDRGHTPPREDGRRRRDDRSEERRRADDNGRDERRRRRRSNSLQESDGRRNDEDRQRDDRKRQTPPPRVGYDNRNRDDGNDSDTSERRPIRSLPRKRTTGKLTDEEWANTRHRPVFSDYKGVPPPTVDGEFTQLLQTEPIFRIDNKSSSGTPQIFFWNGSPSLTFKMNYNFRGVKLVCLQDCTKSGDEYLASVHPGETAAFVKGPINGYHVRMEYSSPPAEYHQKKKVECERRISSEVHQLCKLVRSDESAAEVARVCIQNNLRFVDFTEFPPGKRSLFRDFETAMDERAWMRPEQFLHGLKPQLFVQDHSGDSCIAPNDIDQGALGDCWLLGAVAALAEFPENILRIFHRAYEVDRRLSRTDDNRHGIYRLRLNKNGWWTTVIVDTFLPVSGFAPCFAKNVEQPTELWCSLLEKAFAKLHGSYGSIRGGPPECALQDLTGWPSEDMPLDDKNIFQKLLSYDQQRFLMTIATKGEDKTDYDGGKDKKKVDLNEWEKVGLVCGHAYSLLQIVESGGHQLCQIRNPWGDATQWNGEWSDSSPLWNKNPETRDKCKFTKTNDGTFWMPWRDVRKYFKSGAVCYAKPHYKDIRVRGCFDYGLPSMIMEITVKEQTRIFATVSQIDQRGTSANSKAEYEPLMLSLAYPSKSGYDNDGSLDSHGGKFYGMRDIQFRTLLNPCSRPYYLIPRCYSKDCSLVFVTSFLNQKSVSVNLVRPTKKLMDAFRYSPFKFEPSGLSPAPSRVQINGKDSSTVSSIP